ncbi:MAG: hypothetical protein HYT62_04285 [Candidatus Yanofskybacteria bacterium]|nr:hypothetical protein [Candidatus Yanofskybacteria bacterium]
MIKNKRGAHFIEFQITDRDILNQIKSLLGSNHKISIRDRNKKWKKSYRLQLGSKEIFNDLIRLGMVPRKSNVLKFPKVPSSYLADFIRGYFDGDGHVSICTYQKSDRKNPTTMIFTGFSSGSRKFLNKLKYLLKNSAATKGGALSFNRGYRLNYSVRDSLLLYRFMYETSNRLFLERKKSKFEYYFENWGHSSIG